MLILKITALRHSAPYAGNDATENLNVCLDAKVDFIIKRNLRREQPETWLAIAKQDGMCCEERDGKCVYLGSMIWENKKLVRPMRVVYQVIECYNGSRWSDPEGTIPMHIELSRNSSVKLYLQIAKTLADRIQSGLLPQGTKLPSVRHLSSLLSVSPVTVSKAYAELESIHLVVCTQGKGCYVAEPSVSSHREEALDLSWQMSLIDYLPRAQLWRNFNHSRQVPYSFHIAAVQPELLPTREIIDDTQRLSSEDPDAMAVYGTFEGDVELREVFAAHLSERGIRTAAEHLLVTSGAQQGIDLVARTFVGPGDIVYMEAPTYTGAIDVFTSRGAKVVMIPMDEQGMRMDILTHLCDTHPPKLIYTIPTFHNPTGITLTTVRRMQLLDLAQSYHCLIVEDDPFSDLYYKTKPPLPIKAHDLSGHVIYIKSFSKTVAPGCRIACVVATGSVLDRLVAAKSTTDLGSPLLTQKALLPFIRHRLDNHLVSLRDQMQDRLTTALHTLQRFAPAEVTWQAPEGGLNIWIKLPPAVDIAELGRLADREGISFLPGRVCYAGGMESNHIRISFSYTAKDTLEAGLHKLCRLLGELLDRSVIMERRPIL